jgi:formimidoylglutamase
MMRRGCRFGPKGIREALVFSTSYEPGLDVDLSNGITIVDFGDVDCLHTDVLGTHQRVETVITEVFRLGVSPVILGGDHSITYATAKSLMNTTQGNIGLIMIDGHLDVRISHHGEVSSGTPFRRLLEVPGAPLRGRNLVELGINGWHNSKFYRDYCHEKGVTIIPARQVHLEGIEAAVERALERASDGTEAVFLSVDIDGLDFAAAPGTSAPNPGGLTSFQALEAVWLIGQHPLVRGMDIVEVAPPLDVQGLTSMMAAALVMQYLGATKAKMDRLKA